jgi:predicted dehydrogenase
MRLGVIGLGRRWRQRYRPALRALRGQFAVALVCDEVYARAAHEARALGCAASAGPTELLESDDVEAVLLPDPQWFGLWPLEHACRLGKPVLCGEDVLAAEPDAERLRPQVRQARLPVLAGLAARVTPATAALRELLAGPLGPPRGVTGDLLLPPGERGLPPSLLDWCAVVLGADPVGVLASATPDGRSASLLLEFPGERRALLSAWPAAHAAGAPLLRVFAERGWAEVRLPDRLRWEDAASRQARVEHGRPAPEAVLLEQFADAVQGGRAPEPSFDEGCRVLGWLRSAERSRAEGCRVALE